MANLETPTELKSTRNTEDQRDTPGLSFWLSSECLKMSISGGSGFSFQELQVSKSKVYAYLYLNMQSFLFECFS